MRRQATSSRTVKRVAADPFATGIREARNGVVPTRTPPLSLGGRAQTTATHGS